MTKFAQGHSGNPLGRKKGMLNKRTQLAKLLEPHAESLIQKAVELALDGDSNALRLCIERLIPKAQAICSKDIGLLDKSFTEKAQTIFNWMASGEIPLANGEALMKSLVLEAKVFETDELIRRIETLEEKKYGK